MKKLTSLLYRLGAGHDSLSILNRLAHFGPLGPRSYLVELFLLQRFNPLVFQSGFLLGGRPFFCRSLQSETPHFHEPLSLLSRSLGTLAVTIDTATSVAEPLLAAAGHTVAPEGPLDPKVALRALLEFLALCVLDELFIVLT